MRPYGGQQLTTGAQAEVYPDHFIASHLKVIGGGKTYAQLSAEAIVQPVIAQAYAALHGYWVGYSAAAQHSRIAQAGIIAPGGRWLARCPGNGQPAVAVADLDPASSDEDIVIATSRARPWRRRARAGLYDSRTATTDPRSAQRAEF
jgi:hypothetical protein